MADGMDKAFFVSTSEENVELAVETIWEAATVMSGTAGLEVGVVPMEDGGFLLLARQPGECVYWRITPQAELRTVTPHGLVRYAKTL